MNEKITFKLRNEEGLHCRFCKTTTEEGDNLFETFPIQGIVCEYCKKHLECYINPSPPAGDMK
jgi:hypothetical protein